MAQQYFTKQGLSHLFIKPFKSYLQTCCYITKLTIGHGA